MSEFSDLAQELAMGCRILAEQEIIDAYGHLSARYPGRDDVFVINRGMSPAQRRVAHSRLHLPGAG
jgi:hypothetical protein